MTPHQAGAVPPLTPQILQAALLPLPSPILRCACAPSGSCFPSCPFKRGGGNSHPSFGQQAAAYSVGARRHSGGGASPGRAKRMKLGGPSSGRG